MIISVPHMVSKEDRVRQSSSNLYGNDPQTFRSDYTPWKPGIPQLLLVEQPVPASTVLPHYHSQDQFQIFLDGGGRLGRQEIKPISIHYTNRYTGYGPIVAGEQGVSYYVLRPEYDTLVTGQYLHVPSMREKLKSQKTNRKAVTINEVALRSSEELLEIKGWHCDRVIDCVADPLDEGLFADVLCMGPHAEYRVSHPNLGGGQMIVLLKGSVCCSGEHYSGRSAMALTADESPVSLKTEDSGAQILVLQYPKRPKKDPLSLG